MVSFAIRLRACHFGKVVLLLLLSGLARPTLAVEALPYVAIDIRGKQTQPRAGRLPHPCVLDTRTGLIWEVKTADDGVRDKDWLYSWFVSIQPETGKPAGYPNSGRCHHNQGCDTQSYVSGINKSRLCGYRDWRLPSAAELEGLLEVAPNAPKIAPLFFPNTPASYFWSSDYVALEVGGAVLVSFDHGLSLPGNSASGAHVRLVRGSTKP
jgi:hypothetical protein